MTDQNPDDDHSRKADVIIGRMDQKLDDHIRNFSEVQVRLKQWQDTHEEWCKSNIKQVEERLTPLEEAFDVVDRPARWIGRFMVLTVTGVGVWVGEKVVTAIAKHFQ